MIREVDIKEISDGRFYQAEDPVMVGCHDCANCSDCCRVTGDSIILDPLDMYRLCLGTGKTFEEMIEREIEIRLVDGMILPNLMQHDETQPSKEDGCPFLNAEGRCSIHAYRPGFCRLFPMGRYYYDHRQDASCADDARGFYYFLQKGECTKQESERYEVKLADWLDTDHLERYERFVTEWHFFLKDVSGKLSMLTEKSREQITRYVLQMFFVLPYNGEQDFYLQYELRMSKVRQALAPLGLQ